MFPILHLGPLAIQAPGLILLAVLWLGLVWTERHAPHFGLDPNRIYNLAGIGLAAGLLGARLAFALQYAALFLASPLNLLSPSPTMLNVEAGLLIGCLAAAMYGQRRQMPLWGTLDALTPAFSLFLAGLHLADLASGNAFGTPTRLPWGIELWGETRHPVQLYELGAALLIAWGIWRLLQRRAAPGRVFWTFVALSALARLFFEMFRGDAQILSGGIHIAQVAAWILLGVALWALRKPAGQKPPPPAPPPFSTPKMGEENPG